MEVTSLSCLSCRALMSRVVEQDARLASMRSLFELDARCVEQSADEQLRQQTLERHWYLEQYRVATKDLAEARIRAQALEEQVSSLHEALDCLGERLRKKEHELDEWMEIRWSADNNGDETLHSKEDDEPGGQMRCTQWTQTFDEGGILEICHREGRSEGFSQEIQREVCIAGSPKGVPPTVVAFQRSSSSPRSPSASLGDSNACLKGRPDPSPSPVATATTSLTAILPKDGSLSPQLKARSSTSREQFSAGLSLQSSQCSRVSGSRDRCLTPRVQWSRQPSEYSMTSVAPRRSTSVSFSPPHGELEEEQKRVHLLPKQRTARETTVLMPSRGGAASSWCSRRNGETVVVLHPPAPHKSLATVVTNNNNCVSRTSTTRHRPMRTRLVPPKPVTDDLDALSAGAGLAMLRGLALRADASMYLVMGQVNDMKDCGCPLKVAVTTIKQILLGALPHLSKKIKDGQQWDVSKKDVMMLDVEHAGPLARALKVLVTSHDYLKNSQRIDHRMKASLTELYSNVHIFVALARLPHVQRQLSPSL